ncbi:MAG: hypothetical protein AAGA55_11205 [Planctomycetota bacterium]
MLGINANPPDSGASGGAETLERGSRGMQALLIAAISASSLSLLFSIGTAALSAGVDRSSQESAPTVRGQAGTESSREISAPAARVGCATGAAWAVPSGVFG